MTLAGWIIMGASLVLVWGLTGWCYARLLAAPSKPDDPADG